MGDAAKVVTETWRDKPYERLFTDEWFEVTKVLRSARSFPTIEHLKAAFSAVYSVVDNLILSTTHMVREQEKVMPVLEDIQKILYGDPRLPSIQNISKKYGVSIIRIRNKPELQNGILLARELSQVITLLRQWALEIGLWVPKPIERKFGTEAIAEVLEQ